MANPPKTQDDDTAALLDDPDVEAALALRGIQDIFGPDGMDELRRLAEERGLVPREDACGEPLTSRGHYDGTECPIYPSKLNGQAPYYAVCLAPKEMLLDKPSVNIVTAVYVLTSIDPE